MDQHGSATKTGYPVRYFDQQQQPSTSAQYAPSLYGNFVAYPPATSYLHNQSTQIPPVPQPQYDNTYNQVLTDYASNQYFQQYSQTTPLKQTNKTQTSMKWNTKKKTPYSKPSNASLFYCEVCKISCAGEQTYKEHCDGQKHKKKELNLQNTPSNLGNNQKSTYFCQVCQVNCSGSESYNAHLNGKSHIKVCNLQVKLGKEVPADLIAPIMKPTPFIQMTNMAPHVNLKNENAVTVIGTPVINFIKGGSLKTMTSDSDAVIEECKEATTVDSHQNVTINQQTTNVKIESSSVFDESMTSENASNLSNAINDSNQIPLLGEPIDAAMLSTADLMGTEPVGLEYISDYTKPNSKAIYYSCSLCKCDFSEIVAKEQHVRGKRHRKNYNSQNKSKNKANRSSVGKLTPNKSMLGKSPSSLKKAVLKGRPPSIDQLLNNIPINKPLNHPNAFNNSMNDSLSLSQTSIENDLFQFNMDVSFIENPGPKFRSKDIRYLLKKHSEIVPKEDDLKQFYKHIGNVEKSLKQVSDDFLQNSDAMKEILQDLPVKSDVRVFQGEIRAGLFGKKLLLRDENRIDLILFCSVKPTIPLLRKLIDVLTVKLNSYEGEKYELVENIDEAAIDIKVPDGPLIRVILTSLIIRELNVPMNVQEDELKDPEQMLDKQKCLDALTSLRRFKWYQAKVAPFNPCPMIVRLLRDLTKREDAWKPLNCWSLELICERVMSNCLNRPTPAEAFKLILQTLASGVLINDHKSDILIADPCEIETVDSLAYLTSEQRVAITESAQTLVQLMTFNKIYKILDTGLIEEKGDDESKNDDNKNVENDAKAEQNGAEVNSNQTEKSSDLE